MDDQKNRVTAVFNAVASGYDREALRFFAFCADRLVAHLDPKLGEKILDIAAGTGAVTLALAQAVGASGRVTAIDLAEGMLDRLAAKAEHLRVGNVDVHVMDAETLEFRSDYFHRTACGFGIFFLPDMVRALESWVRVTRPGGRVMFSSFGPMALRPMADRLLERLGRHGVDIAAAGPRTAAERLEDPQACGALLAAAGLEQIEVHTERIGYHLPPADWWDVVWYSGFRGLVERLPETERDRFREAHLAEVATLAGPDGLWLEIEVHYAGGRKP